MLPSAAIFACIGAAVGLVRLVAPHVSFVERCANTILGVAVVLLAFAAVGGAERLWPECHLSVLRGVVLAGVLLPSFVVSDYQKRKKGRSTFPSDSPIGEGWLTNRLIEAGLDPAEVRQHARDCFNFLQTFGILTEGEAQAFISDEWTRERIQTLYREELENPTRVLEAYGFCRWGPRLHGKPPEQHALIIQQLRIEIRAWFDPTTGKEMTREKQDQVEIERWQKRLERTTSGVEAVIGKLSDSGISGGPRLVVERTRAPILHGYVDRGVVGIAVFLDGACFAQIAFRNEPLKAVESAAERAVRARVIFSQDGREVLRVDGRWADAQHPLTPRPTIAVDFEIGEVRYLNIAARVGSGQIFAFGEQSLGERYLSVPAYSLPAPPYDVSVDLFAVGVRETYSFRLAAQLPGLEMGLEPIGGERLPR